MKKIFCVVVALLFLCSCQGGEVSPQLTGISFTAELVYYNEKYVFDGIIDENGILTAEIKEPESLCDLKLTMGPDGTTAEYKGIKYTPVANSLPFSKKIDEFYESLYSIISSAETVESDKNGKIKFGDGVESFTLTVSPSGLPQRLEIPDDRFYITFYNLSVCEDVNE